MGNKTLAIAAGGGLVVVGIMLASRKPPAIRVGDTVGLTSANFDYRGPAADLWLCWGIRKDWNVDFNDGGGLLGDVFVAGGPIVVQDEVDFRRYSLDPRRLPTPANLTLQEGLDTPGDKEAYVWLTRQPTALERDLLFLGRFKFTVEA